MIATNDQFLEVSGAKLHYRIEGKGPFLLMLQAGDGDANATNATVAQLKEHFTVISYDRRGLSQSITEQPVEGSMLSIHAKDIHQLLLHLTPEPVYIFGTSFGALLGLNFIIRHPEQVCLLLAHEPPLTQFLPEPDRSELRKEQKEIETSFAEKGNLEALQKLVKLTGFNFEDKEPDVIFPQPSPQRANNLAFFFKNDAPAAHNCTLDLDDLKRVKDKLLFAAGKTSGKNLAHRCTVSLAAVLGKEVLEFTGGHNSFMTHPKALATELLKTFQGK